jgi:hypothetical protein
VKKVQAWNALLIFVDGSSKPIEPPFFFQKSICVGLPESSEKRGLTGSQRYL